MPNEEPQYKAKIRVIDYSTEHIQESEVKTVAECMPHVKSKKSTTWINIDGLKDTKLLEEFGANLNLHPLVVEDICHTRQRPKMEDYDDYLYIVARMLSYSDKSNSIESEQVSIIVGETYILSIQEKEGDLFDNVRERIRKGKIRRTGPDFLAYLLLDTIVDNYFAILEKVGEKVELLEESVVKDPSPKSLFKIRALKREMLKLRKSVWPLRELLLNLERESTGKGALIKKETALYLRDVYDHTIQVIDTTETFRDTISGMVDIYLSSLSNRMNEIMKVLTVVGTIFIPLTFITGVYGMNFKHMPELEHTLGYPSALLLMFLLAVLMLLYFRQKKWL
ncbi:magnesium/cobalt transporter CorA [Candidatus Micrarchaeota archaeon]|nr:magnesium/cobalt transporter CorA [Candidatus Micrarchaeota archaeon]